MNKTFFKDINSWDDFDHKLSGLGNTEKGDAFELRDHVKHLPYEKSAAMYVSKYVCDTKTNWGLVNNA